MDDGVQGVGFSLMGYHSPNTQHVKFSLLHCSVMDLGNQNDIS